MKDDGGAVSLEDLHINDFFALIEQHKSYVVLLTANKMMTDDKKTEILKRFMIYLLSSIFVVVVNENALEQQVRILV